MRFKIWFSGYAEFDAGSYEQACEKADDQLSRLGSPTVSLEPDMSATVTYDASHFQIHPPSWRIGGVSVEGEHFVSRQEVDPTKSCSRCGFTVAVAPPEPLPTQSESDAAE